MVVWFCGRSSCFNHHLYNRIFTMGHEFQYLLETKRFVWLVALVFAIFMMFQYFQFPNGYVVSSLFPVSDGQIVANTTRFHASDISNISSLHNNTSNALSPISATHLPQNSPALTPTAAVNITLSAPTIPLGPVASESDRDVSTSVKDFNGLQKNPVRSDDKSSATKDVITEDVVTISEMHDMLVHNRASSRSMKPRWSSAVDKELLDAKFQIENAHVNENDPTLYAPLFVNVSRFKRSYELMEKTLKVYIYKEGAKPIFHEPQAVQKGIYASEGWFMKNMKASQQFVTKKPKQAHLFYLPFSSRMLEEKLFVPDSHSHNNLVQYLKNYLDLIAGKYSFWNRTGGSDHFFVACHDWTPSITKKHMNTCIRAMCNSDIKKEGFTLGKDVPLPETLISSPKNPLREYGGKPASERSTLAFFAGRMHGDVRPILLQHWQNKDPDMKIFGKLPKSKHNINYINYMKSSKYCICAKGYEVNSPRVVEAIFYDCVPVIISDNFVPPFFEVLNWESFAVFVKEKDIPNLKKILVSIPESRYLVMQERVKKVQEHFFWHVKPIKYDIFHMILHSIWYTRVFRTLE
ncbi:putative xylogalacturonan beta-1,3-xylosyltransferase [Helianthus annuus]|uniref:Xylogalacturonan beta-1,3-xylosyltransferase n=1 Tax=Helianthus annuus TaxID=4232 RepID=A0A9K3JQF7_HELAN|nr:putative xylogalacturonan beta-1,3-xylosyltransferase [Helianthus annuus]KAJ0619480.1 putative xylogalacturonan beta-1,3-xylosyltransferase [Helianthus annuus]KAJ0940792.1 putative xylogalacturonan beta-1,3-xylosyltransferase [Helianthus annuus]